MRRAMLLLSALLPMASASQAQTPAADKPTPAQDAEQRLHQDWAWLGRYQQANAAIPPSDTRKRVVFIGDSITQGWFDKVPGFFGPDRIDRGIGGQTTPQMVLRFRQDVIDLHPAVVQIMGGTNDIASNTGPMTLEQTQANIMMMCDLARANGIRVILASIPPAANFPWRPGLEVSSKIARMNLWLKGYAARIGATYADYWTALHDGPAQREAFTVDGVHPNERGYAAMAPVAEVAIRDALARPAPAGLPR
ncbi:GDSL-type esterase/lipase family protein [Sphingomonas sp. PAMC 26617]|uniref:GDSL-type esterase/lipase family protein n=1 Tax=Sphingomonas sp. PAMC 26617 TaxID=1112216 RepID=UPI000289F958|nr:GDSL-type esterase/lipase family protein [Sphingomonas sp. PAMC 26617]